MTAATTIITSYSGISDPNNYPPENALAVGPQSIVTAESVPYEFTDLTGGGAVSGSQFQLFSSLGSTLDNSVFDTRVAYDSSTGRFVMIANNLQPGGTATNIDIAVSRDGNPADGWIVGSIDTSNGGTTQSDMPYLSVSNGNIYLTAPEYSGSPLVGSGEWVVSESSVVNGASQILASNSTPATAAVMRDVSGDGGVTYYVSAQSDSSQTVLTYQTYSASTGFSATQTLALGNSDQGHVGGNFAAQQQGTSLTLDAGDSRIESLAYSNGYVYGVSETMPAGASTPSIHWFKLDVTNSASPQLVSQGDLSGAILGDPNIALFNASIAVDGYGDLLINFTASGPNLFPSDYYVVQGVGDPTFGAPTLYQASTSYFQQTAGATGMQRWGTYSSAIADPASQHGFWISNEYVTNTGVTIPSGLNAWWDTVVTQVQVAPYAPILGGAGAAATFTQGGSATPLDSAVTVQDVGSPTLAGATVAISAGLLLGDTLAFTSQAGIAGNFNAVTGVLTLSGTASLAAYQAALRSIAFSSSSADASGGGTDPLRTITWTATDGAETSTPMTTTVNIGASSRIITGFSGISDPTNYPPQNALAVGPQYIVTAETTRYEVTNLTGGAATNGSLYSLFSPLGASLDNSVYDPRAAYDPSTGRFIVIANNIQPGGSTNIDIAISNDSNPADGWSVGSLDTSSGGLTQSDMPDLSVTGVDGNLYLTAPEYPGSGFSGTGQWVLSESSIINGSPQILASESAPPSEAIMRNVSGSNGVTYYASAYSNGSQTILTYQTYTVSGGFSASQTLRLGNSDQGPGGSAYTAQQAGTSLTLDAGDSHIQSLAYSNGFLFGVSETLPVGASAPVVHWFKLDVTNPASPQLAAQGDLSGSVLGDPNIAIFNPSIAVDGNGDLLINFTASGPNTNPSDYYVVQGAKSLAFSAPVLYQASTSYFQQSAGATGVQRWGSHSSAVADPNNANSFWISNEYVTSAGVTIPSGVGAWWDTAVAQISVGGSVTVSVSSFLTGQASLDALAGGFSISDIATNVASALDALNSDSHITSIALTDPGTPALTLTVAQLGDATALGEIATPYAIVISDTAAHVAAGLDALNANARVGSIALTDPGTPALTLTVAQLGDATALGEIATPYAIAISDTAAHVAAGLDALNANARVGSIALTDPGTPALTLTVAQLGDATALGEIATPYAIAISDTAAHVAAGLDALNANARVSSIALTDAGTPALTLTTAQASNDSKALGEITTPYTIIISNTGVSIAASAAIVSTNLDSYEASLPTSITITDNNPLTVTVGQIASDAVALSITTNANGSAYTLAISDTAAHVAAALDALNANAHVSSIALTDPGTPALTLTVATALSDARAVSEIVTPHTVALADTATNIASLTSTQVAALKAAGYASVASTTGKVSMPVAEAQLLTSGGISVTGAPLVATGAVSAVLALTAAQASGLSTAGYALQVVDTAARVQALTAAQVAALASLHVTQISASDTSANLTVALAAALETANIPVSAPIGSRVQISDIATRLQALTVAQISALPVIGVSGLYSSNTAVRFTVAQTIALESAGLSVTPYNGAKAAVLDTGANIATLTLSQIAAFVPAGIGGLASNSGSVALSLAQAVALESPVIKVTAPVGSIVGASDTAANIQALTIPQIAGLKSIGVTALSASDANVALTVAQAAALEAAGVSLSPPAGGSDAIVDTAAHIQALTAAQVASLASLHVTQISASDTSANLSVALAAALETAKIPVSAPAGSRVQISDIAAHLTALTVAQISALPAIGVSGLYSSNAAVRFTVAQTIALESAGLTITPYNGAKAAVSDTGANIATLTPAQIAALPATGMGGLGSTSGGVGLSAVQTAALEGVSLKITAPSGSKVTLSDQAVNIQAMPASQLALLSSAGIGGVIATDASVALSLAQAVALESPLIKVTAPVGSTVGASDTAANIQALTIPQIAGLKSIGVTALSASDANLALTVAQAAALEKAGVSLSPPAGGSDAIVDTAAHIQALTAAQVASLASLHVTQISASDTSANLSVALAAALETANIPVSAPGGSRVQISDTATGLQALTAAQIDALPAIGVSGLYSDNTSVIFNASQTSAIVAANQTLSAVGVHTAGETFANGAVIASGSDGTGGGALTFSTNANGAIVNQGAGALSVTAGSQTIPLSPHGTETITASGHSGETFILGPGFGNDTIVGFAATGASHDLIEFEASMFSYLTPGMTQAAELSAVLGNATTSGSNTRIVDSAGDSLTLNSVSLATLTANPADFKFV